MRKSENFDLNLYEGTDIFNPLTTDVPNYEKIDAQMEKNYNSSVGKATELKTGTVHALTRENTDCPMIHFTATSNFTSNDTFTVDGVQVSALLVDGSTLPTNCYIIGSEVICYLKGTLLTFFLSGSTSKDSEKLGGELPSVYAKQSEVDNLSNTISAHSSLIEQNSNNINDINGELNKMLTFLDYGKTMVVDNKSSYTATEDCLCIEECRAGDVLYDTILINGYTVGIYKTDEHNKWISHPGYILKANDSISIVSSGTSYERRVRIIPFMSN